MISDIYDTLYDKIGKTYDMTRRSDPGIVSKLIYHLSPKIGKTYLDVGCGSGNYTQAIYEKGFNICGLDISRQMLDFARKKNPQIQWIHGDARSLPFTEEVFDGAICILATHHFKDIDVAFSEVFRAMRHGTFVIFSALPEHMKKWWLFEYYPNLMRKACSQLASFDRLSQTLRDAGFQDIRREKYFVANDLQDKILFSGKYHPEIYLDPTVRAGISHFALEENKDEIALGCERLKKDIESGKINQVMQAYANELGDYVFIAADKLNR
jgi:ubiquinone/menaquinone biosynthesis C-methylase UbiE